MDLNDLNKVWEIKPLERVGENEARELLEKVGKQVQPIMKKRKWKVKILSEFCPQNPSLLGLNIGGGTEIKLRLRKPNNEWDFFPFELVLDTMLHELCHNEYGPHNADFYNLLDELRKECNDLIAKGITGSGKGFDLPGRRLGGYSPHFSLPMLRQKALAAAEKRAQRETLLSHGPKRLGGDNSLKAVLTPVQAAAMAAERRLSDDLWCGSISIESEDSFPSSETDVKHGDGSSRTPLSEPISVPETKSDATWHCLTCTLVNQNESSICEACGSTMNKSKANNKLKIWSCKFCTLFNSLEVNRCLACGEWRYSHGPPVASSGPYSGT